jgi:hypothetical protein
MLLFGALLATHTNKLGHAKRRRVVVSIDQVGSAVFSTATHHITSRNDALVPRLCACVCVCARARACVCVCVCVVDTARFRILHDCISTCVLKDEPKQGAHRSTVIERATAAWSVHVGWVRHECNGWVRHECNGYTHRSMKTPAVVMQVCGGYPTHIGRLAARSENMRS